MVVSNIFCFHPYLGEMIQFDKNFSDGLNHQLARCVFFFCVRFFFFSMDFFFAFQPHDSKKKASIESLPYNGFSGGLNVQM